MRRPVAGEAAPADAGTAVFALALLLCGAPCGGARPWQGLDGFPAADEAACAAAAGDRTGPTYSLPRDSLSKLEPSSSVLPRSASLTWDCRADSLARREKQRSSPPPPSPTEEEEGRAPSTTAAGPQRASGEVFSSLLEVKPGGCHSSALKCVASAIEESGRLRELHEKVVTEAAPAKQIDSGARLLKALRRAVSTKRFVELVCDAGRPCVSRYYVLLASYLFHMFAAHGVVPRSFRLPVESLKDFVAGDKTVLLAFLGDLKRVVKENRKHAVRGSAQHLDGARPSPRVTAEWKPIFVGAPPKIRHGGSSVALWRANFAYSIFASGGRRSPYSAFDFDLEPSLSLADPDRVVIKMPQDNHLSSGVLPEAVLHKLYVQPAAIEPDDALSLLHALRGMVDDLSQAPHSRAVPAAYCRALTAACREAIFALFAAGVPLALHYMCALNSILNEFAQATATRTPDALTNLYRMTEYDTFCAAETLFSLFQTTAGAPAVVWPEKPATLPGDLLAQRAEEFYAEHRRQFNRLQHHHRKLLHLQGAVLRCAAQKTRKMGKKQPLVDPLRATLHAAGVAAYEELAVLLRASAELLADALMLRKSHPRMHGAGRDAPAAHLPDGADAADGGDGAADGGGDAADPGAAVAEGDHDADAFLSRRGCDPSSDSDSEAREEIDKILDPSLNDLMDRDL